MTDVVIYGIAISAWILLVLWCADGCPSDPWWARERHLTRAEIDALTDEQIAAAIVAHAERAGLSVNEFVDREIEQLEVEL